VLKVGETSPSWRVRKAGVPRNQGLFAAAQSVWLVQNGEPLSARAGATRDFGSGGIMVTEIFVEVRNVYGNRTIYPLCTTSKRLAALAGTIGH
jgi:hypothetical protein